MRRRVRHKPVFGLLALLWASGALHAAPVATDSVRLRIYWGGGEPTTWTGRVSAEGGAVTQLGRLSVGPTAAADVFEADNVVGIRSTTRTIHNAFDITLQVGEAERLRIELQGEGKEAQVFEPAISDLLTTSFAAALGDTGGRLVVHRPREDLLRIKTDRSSLILTPGEPLPMSIDAVLTEVEPLSPLDISVEVRRGRAGELLSTDTQRVETPESGPPSLTTQVTFPSEEGVYSVRVAVVRPPGLTKVFLPRSTGKVLAERTFQVLVFDANSYRRLAEPGILVAEIDPSSARWWERVPRWVWPRRLRPDEHLSSVPPTIVDADAQRFVEIPAAAGRDNKTGANSAGNWHAYPLPVSGAGAPHVVEIDYPADRPQTLTVAILDRDAAGATVPLGASDEVFVDDWATTEGNSENPQTRTVRRLFWPSSGAPLLLLSNHGDRPAQFGKLRVYRLDQIEQATARPEPPSKLVALNLTEARLSESVGASLAMAADGSVAFDDWQTWRETAARLADLVQLKGANAATLAVASSRGSIYPSEIITAVPGADREPLANSASDLPRKDLLELLLLEFDRRGLRLFPVVSFEGALPRLEGLWRASALTVNDRAYDPAQAEVAAAMRDVVGEIVTRYGSHPALAGVAIDVGAGGEFGFGRLSTPEGGQSVEQVNHFMAASGLTWPSEIPRNAETTAIALRGPWRTDWNAWRRSQLIQAYQSLSKAVQPGRQVILLTRELRNDPTVRPVLTPALDQEQSLEPALAAIGISPGELRATAGVQVAATYEVEGDRTRAAALLARHNNQIVREAGDLFGADSPVMLTRTAVTRRLAPPLANSRLAAPLPELQAISTPSMAVSSFVTLMSDSPDGPVLEGGREVSLLIDPDLVSLRRELAQQASSKRQYGEKTEVASERPLLVRSVAKQDGLKVELLNALPWPIEASLTVESEQVAVGGWADDPPARLDAGSHVLSRQVPAYGVAACEFDSPSVRVAGVRSALPPQAKQMLADRLQDLKRRDLSVQSSYRGARNLSFEELNGNGHLIGWEAITRGGAVYLIDREPQDGEAAIELSNPAGNEAAVVLQTRPLPAPDTGQLAVTFHLRPEQVTPNTRVIVRIEEVGGDYASSTTLDAERLDQEQLQQPSGPESATTWRRPYAFAASDLPIGEHPIRLVFELAGEGTIALDQIELYDLVFPLDLGAQSTRQKLALLKIIREAESAFERDDLAECYRLLDGYWPRFLQAYTPLLPEPAPEAIVEVEAAEEASEEEEPANVSNGWRSYLPRFWR